MIVDAPLPGQEERNADYLLEQGVALRALDQVTLAYRIGYLLEHPDKLTDMERRAKALGRPDAARRVPAKVLAQARVRRSHSYAENAMTNIEQGYNFSHGEPSSVCPHCRPGKPGRNHISCQREWRAQASSGAGGS